MLDTSEERLIASAAFLLFHASTCALIALIKGRRASIWFLIGWFAPLIGIIIIACLPTRAEQPDYRNLFRQAFRGGMTSRSPQNNRVDVSPSPEAEEPHPGTDEPPPSP